ncbi:hypothetical protein DOV67_14375 [Salmonella enterica subsp. enterica serovar Java]|uniref:Uncharacterized protein n=3 Tax=Salmonella enterica TaxID=28901 RepID=A0A403JY45_SALER|nr:hypothetical protein [Salmonella enterica subsp. enterica serovar Java]EAO1476420.1 hypothetical protein [Salmonella enterica]EBR8572746.1 hypothetical protein [Salmonella enterica subsp. enterica serovar Java]ECS8428084.1 hypothetical protein [Salmonella enterica]EDR2520090.1 hypothetical protein [Salmonella enterica subsp. enterica serovar Java]
MIVTPAAILWFRDSAHYYEFMEIFSDAESLPTSYGVWRDWAEKHIARFARHGQRVVKVEAGVTEFITWCTVNKVGLDANGRSKFATSKAKRDFFH